MRTSLGGRWFATLIAAALAGTAAAADSPGGAPAQIAIIIDDLGEQHGAGLRALRLPGPVALAFLPQTRHAAQQARMADMAGKEVLLHLPLEPARGAARAYPTAIRADIGQPGLREAFATALASVPHARGVNNHQGSLLTQMPEPMGWLMAELRSRPELYFVDSRTTGSSVAYRTARLYGVPAAERNVFLDNERGEAAVRARFRELIAKARRDERALAIGHPYPETLALLEQELPRLAAQGIRLVAPSELIARQAGHRGPFRNLRLSPALNLATTQAGPGPPAATSAATH
ncbi:MAG TPA: divergent polysaccharide deacetylase family protein [Verrucomicrobiae bacterium]|nr:divergent polysaccharide deacetylase family protein [Verrucomicrobiae bacterium]